MKSKLAIIALILLSSCTKNLTKNNDTGLDIDIYSSDITYEKFKQYVIEYAEEAPYPSLIYK